MKVGKDSVVMGKVSPDSTVGDGSVIVGATDANGNTILNTQMAVGHGAKAGQDSIAIGAFASAGTEGSPPIRQKPSFWFHPITKTVLYIVGVVAAASIVYFLGVK